MSQSPHDPGVPPGNQALASTVDDEDVDDIIGIATEIAEEDRKKVARLDVGDVVQIGEELGLEGKHVEQAVGEFRQREQRDIEAKARRKKRLIIAGAAVGAVFVLLLLLGLSGRSTLRSLKADVDERKAQVLNVMERRQEVQVRYQGAPATPERDAELAGATNRVAIERRRYDKAATAYNDAAGSLTGSLGRMFFGLPASVPLSTELKP